MPTLLSAQELPEGILAVLYDKNKMEATGYAAVLADLTGETVMLVPCYDNDTNPVARFTDDGVLEVRIGGPLDLRAPCLLRMWYTYADLSQSGICLHSPLQHNWPCSLRPSFLLMVRMIWGCQSSNLRTSCCCSHAEGLPQITGLYRAGCSGS